MVPPEILNYFRGYVDVNLPTFTSMCLTSKQFNTLAQLEALNAGPVSTKTSIIAVKGFVCLLQTLSFQAVGPARTSAPGI